MEIRRPILPATLLALLLPAAAAQTRIHVRSFGAFHNDVGDDRAAIQSALKAAMSTAGPVILEFEPGTYRLVTPATSSPGDTHMLWMFGPQVATSIVIDGKGARLEVVNDTTRGVLVMRDMHDVTISNLDIDYVYRNHTTYPDGTPSLFSQGIVVALLHQNNGQRTGMEIALATGFREPLAEASSPDPIHFAHYYDRAGQHLRERTVNRAFRTVTRLPGNLYRLEHDPFWAANDNVQIGDIAVIPLRQTGRHHAVVTFDSDRLMFDGINIFAAPVMGIVAQEGGNLTFRRVGIAPRHLLAQPTAPRPSTIMPTPPGPAVRLSSSARDGIHIRQPRGPVVIENCHMEYTGDDGIAVRSAFARVQAHDPVTGRTLLREYLHHHEAGPVDGFQLVRLLRPTTGCAAELTVLGASPWLAGTTPNTAEKQIVVASPSSPIAGDYVEALANAGSGSVIRNNRIANSGSRGIVFKGRHSRIENNTIMHTHSPGINLCSELRTAPTTEPTDHEAGTLVGNVVVGNRLTRCCVGQAPHSFLKGAINLTNEEELPLFPSLHTDNEISRNEISGTYGPELFLCDATRTLVRHNVLRSPVPDAVIPSPSQMQIGYRVNLLYSASTTFEGNEVFDFAAPVFDPLYQYNSTGTIGAPTGSGFIRR